MADRRRINGPAAATNPPVYLPTKVENSSRTRSNDGIRAAFLRTGVTPTASGSAYLEIERQLSSLQTTKVTNGMKLICTVHGPRALPRSAPFSPHLVLATHVKYAPFATRQRRGYLRDTSERDLSVHLETALRGSIIAERWPKSGVEVIVTIIEGDDPRDSIEGINNSDWDMMNVLAGCITVASAAIADAGIDAVDTVSGGVAALVPGAGSQSPVIVLDPVPSEHTEILAMCCVAYMPSRDEITNLWLKGQIPPEVEGIHLQLISRAIQAAKGSRSVLSTSLMEVVKVDC
ncbi:Exosome complex component MTR3 [Ceratocystis fimbriata CBS 114723]|uniref:Exosome complex component MTR3 n=1 Tax=Ceratocystis fimbriata CBS 114723 TaxID=1035309 RepID=A0A2C5XIK2_9PEZI|nr:Exosome complex component MTR3 [Ceratocystis fimbriata CBS 114723]